VHQYGGRDGGCLPTPTVQLRSRHQDVRYTGSGGIIFGKTGDQWLDPFQTLCSRCGSRDHCTVSCPTKKVTVNNPDSDDSVVKKLLIETGEDEPIDQIEFVKQMKKYWGS
jgi:hypothetical protein